MRTSAQAFATPIKLSAFLAVALVLMTAVATAAPIVPAGQTFLCTPTHVWDGDGPIWCQEGPRVRLAGIAARELDGSCNPGHPCPVSTGVAARDALVSLVGRPAGVSPHGHIQVSGPPMRCRSDGSAGGNRTAAWCVSPLGGDVNCTMIQEGWALRWDRYWRGHLC
jgi:endonuclease YncB( thermonuclease family)